MKRLLFVFLIGCGSASEPPVLGDPSSTKIVIEADGEAPCSVPAKGCPCDSDAGLEPVYCGLVYRNSNGFTDCSPGHLYCRNGAWSGCEGAAIAGD